jgi:hypothetical protein
MVHRHDSGENDRYCNLCIAFTHKLLNLKADYATNIKEGVV